MTDEIALRQCRHELAVGVGLVEDELVELHLGSQCRLGAREAHKGAHVHERVRFEAVEQGDEIAHLARCRVQRQVAHAQRAHWSALDVAFFAILSRRH